MIFDIAKEKQKQILRQFGIYTPDRFENQVDEVEKAKNVGDIHPNGKWVWTEYKPGRFDWRHSKNKGESKGAEGDKTIADEVKEHSETYEKLKEDAKDGKLDTTKEEFAAQINEDHDKEGDKPSESKSDDAKDNRVTLTKPTFRHPSSLPDNIKKWIKSDDGSHARTRATQVNVWLNSLTGRNIVGGTSVGKYPQTLVLDITHHGGEISISDDTIYLFGLEMPNKKDFEHELRRHFKF